MNKCFGECERVKFQKYLDEMKAEKKDLGAALVQSVINDAQRFRQLKDSEQRLAEAIKLLHKDADWFETNGQGRRGCQLRERITELKEEKR